MSPEIGTATVKVEADTSHLRHELEELQDIGNELTGLRLSRLGASVGDAAIVMSVLAFFGYVIHMIWG